MKDQSIAVQVACWSFVIAVLVLAMFGAYSLIDAVGGVGCG